MVLLIVSARDRSISSDSMILEFYQNLCNENIVVQSFVISYYDLNIRTIRFPFFSDSLSCADCTLSRRTSLPVLTLPHAIPTLLQINLF